MNINKSHKHYEVARRAYNNTSFSPERRAESECKYFDEICEEFTKIGAVGAIPKFERLFLLTLSAKSRCISSMITGGSNFPIARAEKANARERKISDELYNYVSRVRKAIDKQNNLHKHAISSDADNALELLKEKLAKLQDAQSKMK